MSAESETSETVHKAARSLAVPLRFVAGLAGWLEPWLLLFTRIRLAQVFLALQFDMLMSGHNQSATFAGTWWLDTLRQVATSGWGLGDPGAVSHPAHPRPCRAARGAIANPSGRVAATGWLGDAAFLLDHPPRVSHRARPRSDFVGGLVCTRHGRKRAAGRAPTAALGISTVPATLTPVLVTQLLPREAPALVAVPVPASMAEPAVADDAGIEPPFPATQLAPTLVVAPPARATTELRSSRAPATPSPAWSSPPDASPTPPVEPTAAIAGARTGRRFVIPVAALLLCVAAALAWIKVRGDSAPVAPMAQPTNTPASAATVAANAASAVPALPVAASASAAAPAISASVSASPSPSTNAGAFPTRADDAQPVAPDVAMPALRRTRPAGAAPHAAPLRTRHEPGPARADTAASHPAATRTRPPVGARCSDILQKASLEPLTAEEAAYLKRECS